ncbi:hypothetical protein OH77DRAFT_1427517 [Trametes cingulata]|nr:hypothetical protein OH77DRAFT_1427517 [Trametes cingulata]
MQVQVQTQKTEKMERHVRFLIDADEEMSDASDSSAQRGYDSDGDADMGGAAFAGPARVAPFTTERERVDFWAYLRDSAAYKPAAVEDVKTAPTEGVASSDAVAHPAQPVGDATMAVSDTSSAVLTVPEVAKPQEVEVVAAAAPVLPPSPVEPAATSPPQISPPAVIPAPALPPSQPTTDATPAPPEAAPVRAATPAPVPPPVIAAQVSVLDYGSAPEPVAQEASKAQKASKAQEASKAQDDDEDDPSQWETIIPHPQASQPAAAPPVQRVADAPKPPPVFKVPELPKKVLMAAQASKETTPPAKTEWKAQDNDSEKEAALRRLAQASRVSSGAPKGGMSPSQRKAAKLAEAAAARKKIIEDAIAATRNLRPAEKSSQQASPARQQEAHQDASHRPVQPAEDSQMAEEPAPLDKGKGRALTSVTDGPAPPVDPPTIDAEVDMEPVLQLLTPEERELNRNPAFWEFCKQTKPSRSPTTASYLDRPGSSRHQSACASVYAPAKQVGTIVHSATIRSSRDKGHDGDDTGLAGEKILVDVEPPAVCDQPSPQTELAVEYSPASPLDWDVEDFASSPAAERWEPLQPSPAKSEFDSLPIPVIEITPPSPSLPPTPAIASPPPAPLSISQAVQSPAASPVVKDDDDDEDFPEPLWPRTPSTPSAPREPRLARPLPKRIARQPAPKLVVSTWSSLTGALGEESPLNNTPNTSAGSTVAQTTPPPPSPSKPAEEPAKASDGDADDLPSPCVSLYSEDEEPIAWKTVAADDSAAQACMVASAQAVHDLASPEQHPRQAFDSLAEVAGDVLGSMLPASSPAPMNDRREDETDAVSALLALSAGTSAPLQHSSLTAPDLDAHTQSSSDGPPPFAMNVEENAASHVDVNVDVKENQAALPAHHQAMDSWTYFETPAPPQAIPHEGSLAGSVSNVVGPFFQSDPASLSYEEMADEIANTLAELIARETLPPELSDALMDGFETLYDSDWNPMDVQLDAQRTGESNPMGFAPMSPVFEDEGEEESMPDSIHVDSESPFVAPSDVMEAFIPEAQNEGVDMASDLDDHSSSEETVRGSVETPAQPPPDLFHPAERVRSDDDVRAATSPRAEQAGSSANGSESSESLCTATALAVLTPTISTPIDEPAPVSPAAPHGSSRTEDQSEEAEVEALLVSETVPASEENRHLVQDVSLALEPPPHVPDAGVDATEVPQPREAQEVDETKEITQAAATPVPPATACEPPAEVVDQESKGEDDLHVGPVCPEDGVEVKHEDKAPEQESNGDECSLPTSSPSPSPASSPRRSRFRSLSPTAQEAVRRYIRGTPPSPVEEKQPYLRLSRPARIHRTREYRREWWNSVKELPEPILLDALSNASSPESSSSESDRSPTRDVPQRLLPRVTSPFPEVPRYSTAEQPRPVPPPPDPGLPPRVPRQRPPQRPPPAEPPRPDARPRQENSGQPAARSSYKPPSYAPPPVPEPPRQERPKEKPKRKSGKDKREKSQRPAEDKPAGSNGDKKSRGTKSKKARAANAEDIPRARPSYPPPAPSSPRPRYRHSFQDRQWEDGMDYRAGASGPRNPPSRSSGSTASFAGEGSPEPSSRTKDGQGRIEDVPSPDFSSLLWFLCLYWCWWWISSAIWPSVVS